jgi:hypothetical protein
LVSSPPVSGVSEIVEQKSVDDIGCKNSENSEQAKSAGARRSPTTHRPLPSAREFLLLICCRCSRRSDRFQLKVVLLFALAGAGLT